MKKFFTLMLIQIAISQTNAQQWTGATNTGGEIQHEGIVNVGSVGTTNSPSIGIMSIGSAYGNDIWGTGYIGFNLRRRNRYSNQWDFGFDGINNAPTGNMGASIIYGTLDGGIFFSTRGKRTPNSSGFMTSQEISDSVRLRILPNGAVAIGKRSLTTPGQYKLFVEGGILTEELKIALRNSNKWADYVFQPDYRLPKLLDIDAFIKKNKHLPNMPSGEEIVNEGGIDLKTIIIKQQEAIEQLYLHVINLQNEINKLKSKKDE